MKIDENQEYMILQFSTLSDEEIKMLRHCIISPETDEVYVPVISNKEIVEMLLGKAIENIPYIKTDKRS